MNLIARTKNSLEFNFISAVFFCLLFTQFFNNGTQLNIGIWQGESDYNSISTNASTLTTKTIALGRITNASALERIGNNLQNSFQEVAINTVASSASQSAINGDSFSDSLKAQGKNVLIYTLAKVGANEIGRAYHGTTTLDANGNVISKTPPTIDKSEQLLLHAGLGAITSSLTGNDAMSGAIAGVVGELTAEIANENGADVATSIQLANLAGAISSITYGGLTNQSDDEMANNAWEGSRIATNAAQNNFAFGKIVGKEKEEKLDKFLNDLKGSSLENIADRHVSSNDPIEKAALFAILVAGQGLPSSVTELELMMITAGASKIYATEIAVGLNKVDDVASGFWSKLFGSSKPELRLSYEQEVKNLNNLANELKLQGKSSEEIARTVNQQRNQLKLDYREQTSPELVKVFEQRNIQKYGNPIGPTANQLQKSGKTWEEIIKSATKPGGKDLGF